MDPLRERWIACWILVAAALLFFGRLGERGVTSEEMRWAQVAREMRHSGDFFRPTINGGVYYDKPIGSYWLIVLASYFTGGVDETAARLPAAAAGLLGVWLTMSLGRRLYDARTGLLAGAILATSFGFAFYARRATADAETVTGVLAAVWLYSKCHDRPGPWIVGLWLIMATTSLTKGLLGFALPVSVLVAHSAWTGRHAAGSWRGLFRQPWLFNRWSLVALPLSLAVFAAPFAVSMARMGSNDGVELLVRENVRRFFAPHNHVGPVYLYAEVVFVLLAPWSLFLPAALLPSTERSRDDMLARAYFWVIFAFFTASASRRSYYLLPIVPAGGLLVARLLMADQVSLWASRLRRAGQWLFVALVAFAGVLLLSPADVLPAPWDSLPPLPARGLFAVGWIVLLGCCVAEKFQLPLPPVLRGERVGVRGDSTPRSDDVPSLEATKSPRETSPSPPTPLPRSTGGEGSKEAGRFPQAIAACAFAGMCYLFLIAIPSFNDGANRQAFVAEVRERVDFETLALFHARDVTFDLASAGPVADYRDAESLKRDLRSKAIVWVIARRRALRDVALPARIVAEETIRPWERSDQSGDRLVLLKGYEE